MKILNIYEYVLQFLYCKIFNRVLISYKNILILIFSVLKKINGKSKNIKPKLESKFMRLFLIMFYSKPY